MIIELNISAKHFFAKILTSFSLIFVCYFKEIEEIYNPTLSTSPNFLKIKNQILHFPFNSPEKSISNSLPSVSMNTSPRTLQTPVTGPLVPAL